MLLKNDYVFLNIVLVFCKFNLAIRVYEKFSNNYMYSYMYNYICLFHYTKKIYINDIFLKMTHVS